MRPDGVPFPSRAWGLDVLDASAGTSASWCRPATSARVGVDRDELAGASIAVTGSDVRTLHTVQVKGTVDAVADVGPDDLKRARRHTSAFFDVIVELDRIPRASLERMVPVDYVALA